MGLLPWEKLPAYVLGPLLIALCGWLLWVDEQPMVVDVAMEVAWIVFAIYLVWRRYSTGKELFANDRPDHKH